MMMKFKEKNFVSAVVYVHNAEESIANFLEAVIQVLEENFEYSEIICVNDASVDESLMCIRGISRSVSSSSITVINMSYFHGVEMAIGAGTDLAIGDFVFQFDNTVLNFDKSEIMNVYYKSLEEGNDIVSASARGSGHFMSKVFYQVFDRFTDIPYRMRTESFRVLSRRAINRINAMNKMVLYRKAVYMNCGLKTDNIEYTPVSFDKNRKDDKKEKRYRMGLAMDSLILFTEAGYRFSIAMTVLMMIVSFFMIIYSIIVYTTSYPVAGWTTTILFLSLVFFGLFTVLTVIIKYLQLLVNLIYKRKHYIYESIEKLTK